MAPIRSRAVLPFLAVALVLAAGPAAAGQALEMRPRRAPGDAYRLSLSTTTETRATSRGEEGKAVAEDVRLDYEATVTVLAVDDAGRPIREAHERVRLDFTRPGESGSLFGPGTAFEVRRDELGRIALLVGNKRVEQRIEELVTPLLERQFEHTLEAQLVDPGRPVADGDTWTLDRRLAKRFLRDRGVRVVDFDGPATAQVRREAVAQGPDVWVIDYRIPMDWLELDPMPVNARPARSQGHFQGQLRLAVERGEGVAVHSSDLDLEMNGIVHASRVTRPFPWRVESSRLVDQRVQPLEPRIAEGGRAPVVAGRSAP